MVQARVKGNVESLGHIQKVRGGSTMPSQLLNGNGKSGVTAASSRDSAGDEEVVAAAKRGDEVAFETLVKRHQQRIFALALRYTRVREDAEDIVQQTLQKAYVNLQNFEGRSSFSTWLTSVAINQALTLLRRRRTRREVPIDDSGSDKGTTPALEIADASPDPEASCLQREKARIVSLAIQQLRPGTRKAIELQELGELSIRETARYMGLSVAAVKARVFHARKNLAKALRCHMSSRRMPELHLGGC
jgi:RNA polymerase sigma factor (sigma-70 family)